MSTIQTGITEQVIAWLFDHLPTVYAVGAAVSISALMSLYDGRTLVQTVTGSLACGVLAMTVAGSLRFFGIPEDAVTFLVPQSVLWAQRKHATRLLQYLIAG